MSSTISCEVAPSRHAGIREREFHSMVQLFADRSLAEVLSEDISPVVEKYRRQGGGVIAAAWVANALSKAGFSYILEPEVRLNLGGSEKILGPYDLAVVVEGKYLVLEIKLLKSRKKIYVEEIDEIYRSSYAKLIKKCGVYIGLLIVDISGTSASSETPDYIAVVRTTGGWGDEEKVVTKTRELARRLGLLA